MAFPLLLFVGKTWARRAVQIILSVFTLVWVHTLLTLAAERHSTAQPWIRMAIILGAVALFTAWTAFAIRERRKEEARHSVRCDAGTSAHQH